MRKFIKKTVFLLAMAMAVAGCGDSIETNMNTSEEVSAFFAEHLFPYSGGSSDCFFIDIDHQKSIYIMINSADEFRENFSCSSTMLPEIDFKSNTLIIGQYYGTHSSGYYVVNQTLAARKKEMELTLYVSGPEYSFPSVSRLFYWGIYPKLKNKPINVNIIYKL